MAKRITKTELVTTTAIVADASVAPLSNVPKLPTEQFIKSVADEGFGFKSVADKANGRATQSIAYSCMALHVLWRNDGPPDIAEDGDNVPDLAGIIHARNKEDKAKLRTWFVDALLGPKVDFAAEQYDQRSKQETERSNKSMLIGRAMNMAAILTACGVTHTDFDRKSHCFSVLPSMLIMPGWSGIGVAAKDAKSIPLDRRPLAGLDEKQSFKRWVASVEQLNKAMRAQMKIKPARSSSSKLDVSKLPSERLAADVPITTLIVAVESLLSQMDKGGKLKPDTFPAETWTKLADIGFMVEAVTLSEAFKLYREHAVSSAAIVATGDAAQIADDKAA